MKNWRIGRITLGLIFIAIGIVWALSRTYNFSIVNEVLKWWPLVLISLGVEIILWNIINGRANARLQVDVFSIILIIIVAVVCAGMYSGRNIFKGEINFGNGSIFRSYKYETKLKKTYTVDAKDKTALHISDEYGDIKVDKSTSQNVEVEADIRIRNNDEEYAKKISDSIVVISKDDPINIKTSIQQFLGDRSKVEGITVDYIIKVPQNLSVQIDNQYGDVSLSNMSKDVVINDQNGNISAQNVLSNLKVKDLYGDITVNNISGDVNIQDKNGNIRCSSTKNLDVKNEYGDVTAEDVKGNVTVNDKNGKIKIKNASGDAKIDNQYGDVTVEDAAGEIGISDKNGSITAKRTDVNDKNVTIDNQYGDVTLKLPKDQGGQFNVSNEYGDLDNDFGLSVSKSNNDNKKTINGSVGSGKAVFSITDRNGDIKITK